MGFVKMEIEFPESMARYFDYKDPDYHKKIREFMAYQLVKDDKVSFGKAAELLGMDKLSFITDLGKMGISYYDMSEEELDEDIKTLNNLLENEK